MQMWILGCKDKEASTDSSSILEEVDYDLTDETALLDENGADSTLTGVTGSDYQHTRGGRTYGSIRFCSPGEAVQGADPLPEQSGPAGNHQQSGAWETTRSRKL